MTDTETQWTRSMDFEVDFADLNYPGSKRPRRPIIPEEPEVEPVYWDSRPYAKVIDGKPVELFSIGALALAMDRSLVTIRLWIRQGRLPQAIYRLPSRETPIYGPDGEVTGHRLQKGRRLYTRAQIEAVVRLAKEHGILATPRIEWSAHPDFALEVADAWQQLAA